MEFKMFLGETLVDVKKINALKLNSPGYIDSLRIEMEEKNEEVIDLSREEPKFCIDTLPSIMNTNKKLFIN
jgi:hypothetical protein